MTAAADQFKEFDIAKQRAAQREQQTLQSQKDAMARRAAQLGGGPSGAFLKQARIAEGESAERLGAAEETIDAAKRAEFRRLSEIEEGRAFQRGEREAGQTFAEKQAEKGMGFTKAEREAQQAFAKGEREAGQGFLSEQSILGREFAKGEREAGQSFAAEQAKATRDWQTSERMSGQDFAAKQNDLSRALSASQFDRQFDFSKEQFGWEKQVDQWNKGLSDRIQSQNEEPGTFDKILGIGTLGIAGSTKGTPLAKPKAFLKKTFGW